MRNFIPTDVCEMRRRFALAEIDSSVFTQENTSLPNATPLTEEGNKRLRNMLLSSNFREVCNAISEHVHGGYVYQNLILPRMVKNWYIAHLDATLDDFKQLRVAPTGYWRGLSNGTFKLTDAANNPMTGADQQTKRIKEIISTLESEGSINLEGIILVCQESHGSRGPWEIVEGHARLVAICRQIMNKSYFTITGGPLAFIPVILGEGDYEIAV